MFLSSEAAVLVYKNMILPMIEYGDIFLTAASKENRGKLQVLQNKALRAALQVDKYYDTADLHSEVGLSKLKTRREQHLLTFMFSVKGSSRLRRVNRRVGVRTIYCTSPIPKNTKSAPHT